MELGLGWPQIGDKTRVMLRLGWGCFGVGDGRGCPTHQGWACCTSLTCTRSLKGWWSDRQPDSSWTCWSCPDGYSLFSSRSSHCHLWGMSLCYPQKLPRTQPASDTPGYSHLLPGPTPDRPLLLLESNSVFSRLTHPPHQPLIPEAYSLLLVTTLYLGHSGSINSSLPAWRS